MSNISSDQQAEEFAIFPEFSKLTFADMPKYERYISSYPPAGDISFQSLMLWWNPLGSCAVSTLNDNLVLSYWLPGDEKNSGLSLIGKNAVDESICTIFDYLKDRGELARLVHVPDFVISSLKHAELFEFTGEQDYDEYIFKISDLYPLGHATEYLRASVKRFLSKVNEEQLLMKSLDLRITENRKLLLHNAQLWFRQGNPNFLATVEPEALKFALLHAEELGVENVCLYIGDRLVGFQLYQVPTDKRYVIATFIELDPAVQGIAGYGYLFYACAKWFAENGFMYINFEQDLGLYLLRAKKITLGPANYFRKYTVQPAQM